MVHATARRRRRGAELERSLLDAAWEEISEHGYVRFTFDGVAVRAGTSKPVLYRRWPGKPELVRAAIEHVLSKDPLTDPDTGTLRNDVIAVMRQANDRRLGVATALIAHLVDLHRATGTSIDDVRSALAARQTTITNTIMRRAVERGEVDSVKLTDRIVRLPADLVRHEFLMTSQAVPDSDIAEIVDTIFLPLVRT